MRKNMRIRREKGRGCENGKRKSEEKDEKSEC